MAATLSALRVVATLGLSWLLATACLYDADDRCDANQHLGPGDTCVCDEGFVFHGQVCQACGEHETISGSACVCEEGYARSGGPEGPCIESGLGIRCEVGEDAACADPVYDVCRDHGEGVGYCTRSCETDDDCPSGYACDEESSPATCMMAPVGQGEACESSADCADFSATYCEVTMANVCLVQGCSMDDPLTCSDGLSCCDLEPLGIPLTLCAPEANCPTAK